MLIKKLREDTTLRITSADKGKAIVIEDDDVFNKKNRDIIDQSDCVRAGKDEKTLVHELWLKIQKTSFQIWDFTFCSPRSALLAFERLFCSGEEVGVFD